MRYAVAVVLIGVAAAGALRFAPTSGKAAPIAAAGPDEIAQAVARELDRRARGDTAGSRPERRTRSIPAYELYLRANDPRLLRNDSTALLGLEYLREAIRLDSTYAAAWAGLARMTYRVAGDGPPDSVAKTRAIAEAALRKALALDDSVAEAHALLGIIRARAGDLETAEAHFRRALALEPRAARNHEWFASFLLLTERPVEALAEAERALALDPLSPSATAEVARGLLANDRCDEALARLETIASLNPPLLRAAPIAAQCYARQGRWSEAIAVLHPQADRGDVGATALLGYMYAGAGRTEEALSIQSRLLERHRRDGIGAFFLVFVPAARGDRDQAFAWLDRALADGSLDFKPGMRVGLVGVPFDILKRDPRWERLRERLGLQKR